MNKLWKKYNKMAAQCYIEMGTSESSASSWLDTYQMLKEAILAEREENPDFAKEFDLIDDSIDYWYDVTGFMEDFFDELEMRGLWDEIIAISNELIGLFEWKEIKPNEFRMKIALALIEQKKYQEALEYAKKWYQEDEKNVSAAVALVYSLMEVKEYAEAEAIVDRLIEKDTPCDDTNEILFIAAQSLYKVQKKQENEISKKLKEYEEMLEQYWFGVDDEVDMNEEDLPFS